MTNAVMSAQLAVAANALERLATAAPKDCKCKGGPASGMIHPDCFARRVLDKIDAIGADGKAGDRG